MRHPRNPIPRPRWLQPIRIAAFAAATSGLGTIVVADAVAADMHEPIAEELETEEDAADERLRFAGFAAVPEASPAPVVASEEAKPEAKKTKKKRGKLRFGRLDAY